MALIVALLALTAVTASHEAGHYLAVRLRGGRVLSLQVGRGPAIRRWERSGTQFVLGPVPVGGRIRYDGVPTGAGAATVAVSGAAANLVLALATFAIAAVTVGATFPVPADQGAIAFAITHTGAWFWAVPGALVELVTAGSALELRRAVHALVALMAERPLRSFPYTVGALSALWAALNLIPVPGLDTDGWHAVRALWRGDRP
jgi:membrane-associated protease RseP (regulator of RpoE activity)